MKLEIKKTHYNYFVICDGKRVDSFLSYRSAFIKIRLILLETVGYTKAIQLLAVHQLAIVDHDRFEIHVNPKTKTKP